MQERRRGVSSAAAEHVNFEQQLRFSVDGGVEPLFLAVNLDLFLIDRDPRRRCRRQVCLALREIVRLVPDRSVRPIDAK